MNEWKDVVGFEGLYLVNNQGEVKSVERMKKNNKGTQFVNERILVLTPDKDGYLRVCLSKNGRSYVKAVHRLVAEAFIPKNGEDKVCVNHKNGNKLDNRVENLEWVSYSENLKHSYDVLNRPVNRTTIKYRNVICTFPNDEVVEVKSIDEASRLTGVSSTQIRRLHGNGKKSRNGYSFYIPSLNVEDSERIVI